MGRVAIALNKWRTEVPAAAALGSAVETEDEAPT